MVKHANVAVKSSENVSMLQQLLTDKVNGPPLWKKLLSGDLTAQSMANATFDELLSEEHKKKDQEETEEFYNSRDQNYMFQIQATPVPFFTCRRCGAKKCMVFEKQTSRGDEGTTMFITCCECKLQWKTRN